MLNARLQMQGVAAFVRRFGLMAETLDAFGDFDEGSECRYAQDFAVHDVTDVMALEEGLPDIRLELLHAERKTTLVGFDCQNNRLYPIALFQNFGRMLYSLGPAQIADVDQTVDAVLNLDKGAEIGQIANTAFDCGANRKLLV